MTLHAQLPPQWIQWLLESTLILSCRVTPEATYESAKAIPGKMEEETGYEPLAPPCSPDPCALREELHSGYSFLNISTRWHLLWFLWLLRLRLFFSTHFPHTWCCLALYSLSQFPLYHPLVSQLPCCVGSACECEKTGMREPRKMWMKNHRNNGSRPWGQVQTQPAFDLFLSYLPISLWLILLRLCWQTHCAQNPFCCCYCFTYI